MKLSELFLEAIGNKIKLSYEFKCTDDDAENENFPNTDLVDSTEEFFNLVGLIESQKKLTVDQFNKKFKTVKEVDFSADNPKIWEGAWEGLNIVMILADQKIETHYIYTY